MTTSQKLPEHEPIPQGDALVKQLRQGWAPLPNRTVLALAMGGLKVRMMRSTITMISVVLAIAFLTYMGLVSRLTKNLIAEMDRLEGIRLNDQRALSDAAKSALAINYFAQMNLDQKKQAAIKFELGDSNAAEIESQGLPKQIREAEATLETVTKASTKVIDDPKSLPGDKVTAAAKIATAKNTLKNLQQRKIDSAYHVAFCQWLRGAEMRESGKKPEEALDERLAAWYSTRMAGLNSLNRVGNSDLEFIKQIVADLRGKLSPEHSKALESALFAEDSKRGATEIRASLVRNGINIESSRTSNAAEYWLGGMSLLTCAIGIANAMLMSVTERFREIGTMKCLGAQDGLVIKLFLIESAFLGVIGAIAGIVLGVLVSVVAGVAQFGSFGLTAFPVWNGFPVLGMSVLGGVILAVLGAIGPARMAAQMRPVDALRVDE